MAPDNPARVAGHNRVGVGTAVWDAVFGSWGNAVASGIYLVLLLLELFWWPKRRDRLLAG